MSASPLGVATFEDTGAVLVVRRFCERCQASVSEGNHTRRMSSWDDVSIVSPSGIAHAQHERGDEFTACGLDATGEGWWWRL